MATTTEPRRQTEMDVSDTCNPAACCAAALDVERLRAAVATARDCEAPDDARAAAWRFLSCHLDAAADHLCRCATT